MPLTDDRMLSFMAFAINNGLAENEKQFLLGIGYTNPGNVSLVRKGSQSFRVEHISNAIKKYGLDANYFFVKSHTQMFAEKKKKTPIMALKEAVAAVEAQLKP